MTRYLMIGTVLGLSAGLAPGPLLTLVIAETLRHDYLAGVKVALSPLFTDLPIILLTVLVVGRLSAFNTAMGLLSLVGGIVLLYMAYQGFRVKIQTGGPQNEASQSLSKGILINLTNPHPYLFWLGVGAPTLSRAWSSGMILSVAFVFGFYFFLVGSKVFLALITAKSKTWLTGRWYLYTLRLLALVLVGFGLTLIYDGLKLFGVGGV